MKFDRAAILTMANHLNETGLYGYTPSAFAALFSFVVAP